MPMKLYLWKCDVKFIKLFKSMENNNIFQFMWICMVGFWLINKIRIYQFLEIHRVVYFCIIFYINSKDGVIFTEKILKKYIIGTLV